MPIPKPNTGESKSDYVSRCMANEKMVEEYPDLKQRAAICHANFSALEEMMSFDAEIFAVGKWNGISFTEDDLSRIADNFNRLTEVLKVPLKFGHNDEQPLTDGQPAIGWVSKVWHDPKTQKLMATLSDLPSVVYDAIKKKLYRKVSIELDRGVSYKGQELGDVLTGVALLGADIPAVSTIDDLTAYMSAPTRGTIAHQGHRLSFTAIFNEEENEMPNEDLRQLSDQLATLTAKVDEQGTQIQKLTTENTALKAENEEFKRKEEDRAKEEAKAKVTLARKTVTDLLEDAVKQEKILPAQREKFHKLLRVDDDTAVVDIDIEELKDTIGMSSTSFSKGGSAHNRGNDKDEGKTPDVIVAERAQTLINEGKAKDFSAAMPMVFQADRDLAAAYRDYNDS